MIKVAYHKTELCFLSQLKLTDLLIELVVIKCSFFYRWLLHSGDCYDVISLRIAEGMLLFNISFRIFYISSCSSGTDDIFKEIWSYNPSLVL